MRGQERTGVVGTVEKDEEHIARVAEKMWNLRGKQSWKLSGGESIRNRIHVTMLDTALCDNVGHRNDMTKPGSHQA